MCTGLQLIIVEQYIQPTIANGITPWKELQWPKLIERVLKLSLPTVYGWLIMFYSVFHLLLNIIAELTGFEDREFYKVSILAALCLSACHALTLRLSLWPWLTLLAAYKVSRNWVCSSLAVMPIDLCRMGGVTSFLCVYMALL